MRKYRFEIERNRLVLRGNTALSIIGFIILNVSLMYRHQNYFHGAYLLILHIIKISITLNAY